MRGKNKKTHRSDHNLMSWRAVMQGFHAMDVSKPCLQEERQHYEATYEIGRQICVGLFYTLFGLPQHKQPLVRPQRRNIDLVILCVLTIGIEHTDSKQQFFEPSDVHPSLRCALYNHGFTRDACVKAPARSCQR